MTHDTRQVIYRGQWSQGMKHGPDLRNDIEGRAVRETWQIHCLLAMPEAKVCTTSGRNRPVRESTVVSFAERTPEDAMPWAKVVSNFNAVGSLTRFVRFSLVETRFIINSYL